MTDEHPGRGDYSWFDHVSTASTRRWSSAFGFHVAITVIMPLLAGLGHGAVRLATQVRRSA